MWTHQTERPGPGPIRYDPEEHTSSTVILNSSRNASDNPQAETQWGGAMWLRLCRSNVFNACRYAQPDTNRIPVNPTAKAPAAPLPRSPAPSLSRSTDSANIINTSIQIANGVRTPDAAW